MNIKPGDTITIGLGSATAHCAIATTSAVFTVVSVTDKAVAALLLCRSKEGKLFNVGSKNRP